MRRASRTAVRSRAFIAVVVELVRLALFDNLPLRFVAVAELIDVHPDRPHVIHMPARWGGGLVRARDSESCGQVGIFVCVSYVGGVEEGLAPGDIVGNALGADRLKLDPVVAAGKEGDAASNHCILAKRDLFAELEAPQGLGREPEAASSGVQAGGTRQSWLRVGDLRAGLASDDLLPRHASPSRQQDIAGYAKNVFCT